MCSGSRAGDAPASHRGTVALPFTSLRLKAVRPPDIPRGYPRCLRSVGDHLRRRRLDLGFGQRTVARQLGVREETVRLWETGRARPLPRNYGQIVRFLGKDPEPAGDGLGERLRAWRRRQGLTQARLAADLGLDERAVTDFEGGRRDTSRRATQVLVALIDRIDQP